MTCDHWRIAEPPFLVRNDDGVHATPMRPDPNKGLAGRQLIYSQAIPSRVPEDPRLLRDT
jgi:hypothetical protein